MCSVGIYLPGVAYKIMVSSWLLVSPSGNYCTSVPKDHGEQFLSVTWDCYNIRPHSIWVPDAWLCWAISKSADMRKLIFFLSTPKYFSRFNLQADGAKNLTSKVLVLGLRYLLPWIMKPHKDHPSPVSYIPTWKEIFLSLIQCFLFSVPIHSNTKVGWGILEI